MNDTKVLRISLLISFFIHTSLIVGIRGNFFNSFKRKTQENKVQIIYSVEKSTFLKEKPIMDLKRFKPKLKAPPPYIESSEKILKKIFKKEPKISVKLPPVKDIKSISVKEDFEELKVKIPSPSYMEYYKLIREKIRVQAYQNYTLREEGKVYLSFIIDSFGNILRIKILENKTCASQKLKEIALLSVKEASPFPPFPKELDFPQLAFNIQITFQYKD